MKVLKLIAVAAWLCLIAISIVSAAYYIYSNVVTVTITTYTVSLSAPTSIIQYNNITLEATLSPAEASKTIEFGLGTSESDFSLIGTNTTDSLGKAILEYNVTQTDSVSFVARYFVP